MINSNLAFLANCSILFPELDLLDRPRAARAAAGFSAVEFWWPFSSATPSAQEVTRFVDAIGEADVQCAYLNLFAGDMSAGERGVLSSPGRQQEFAESLEVASELGGKLGVRGFNALFGNREPGTTPGDQDDIARANLKAASDRFVGSGSVVVLEALSGIESYPMRHAAQLVAFLDSCEDLNPDTAVGLLADLYHLAVNGDDVVSAITKYLSRIFHVQIADAPGRHQPGTGDLALQEWLDLLERQGYRGLVGLEYLPLGATEASFDFLERSLRDAKRASVAR